MHRFSTSLSTLAALTALSVALVLVVPVTGSAQSDRNREPEREESIRRPRVRQRPIVRQQRAHALGVAGGRGLEDVECRAPREQGSRDLGLSVIVGEQHRRHALFVPCAHQCGIAREHALDGIAVALLHRGDELSCHVAPPRV